MIPAKIRKEFPDFLCIGGQRCGSTWLHRILATHPQIALSKKEYNFFNLRIRTDGFQEYRSFFNSCEATVVKGDVSPTYSAMYRSEVNMVYSMLPDLKIVFVIRNPVDRHLSAIARGWAFRFADVNAHQTRNVFALLRQIDNGLSSRLTDYRSTYRLWALYFGEENILVKKFDDLQSNPELFLDEVLNFIGIAAGGSALLENFKKQPNSSGKFKNEIPAYD
jgi:hypothetical protein